MGLEEGLSVSDRRVPETHAQPSTLALHLSCELPVTAA